MYILYNIYMVVTTDWRILWSSYRKLAWVGFESRTTEFRSSALTDWAIRPWIQFVLRASFVELLQFHRSFSVTFHFDYFLRQSPPLFEWKVSWGNHMSVAEWAGTYGIHMVYIYIYIYIIYEYIYIYYTTTKSSFYLQCIQLMMI